jgi:hypothetical protein
MPYHRFKIGQAVFPLTPRLPAGRYTILGLLPLVRDERRYRVRSNDDGHERVVSEEEVGLPATGSRNMRQIEPPLVRELHKAIAERLPEAPD